MSPSLPPLNPFLKENQTGVWSLKLCTNDWKYQHCQKAKTITLLLLSMRWILRHWKSIQGVCVWIKGLNKILPEMNLILWLQTKLCTLSRVLKVSAKLCECVEGSNCEECPKWFLFLKVAFDHVDVHKQVWRFKEQKCLPAMVHNGRCRIPL